MKISAVYVRFYKSFNFDYLRKYAREAKPLPWELIDGVWYPYVRVPLDPSVTTVVGANEAGKTHLLDAIDHAITGTGIDRGDFCRYSSFFSVERGQMRFPDFGVDVDLETDSEADVITSIIGHEQKAGGTILLLRPNGGPAVVHARRDAIGFELTATQLEAIAGLLPKVFRLEPDLALPDSVPVHDLTLAAQRPIGSRRRRGVVIARLLSRAWDNVDTVKSQASEIYAALADPAEPATNGTAARQHDLARSLLLRVADIDPEAFADLSKAMAEEREGYVNGVIQKINDALAAHLNFPRWWAQDREFRLMVSPREYDLVFTIRDKTGTDYSFKERSGGLKYFLSYYVQLLAHEPPPDGRREILLMDEPDAFLSSQGQQDLLRILEAFARPDDRSRADQVVYVTHSPFLINRNHGERIRVLDKGASDEGTRVVRDAARNHYEPLRSALGAFVGETSFIGGLNLFVEGLADQILLAGTSSWLRGGSAPEIETLDLNRVTIIPAGSAGSIPYLVYLARGRDVVRPPSVVFLDSDAAGNDARRDLERGGPRRKQLIQPAYVLQVGDLMALASPPSPSPDVLVTELEDLIPVEVAVTVARRYAERISGVEDVDRLRITDVTGRLATASGSLFDALEASFAERYGDGAHIEKVGFAKELVAYIGVVASGGGRWPAHMRMLENNFRVALAEIAKRLRRADQDETDERLTERVDRVRNAFLIDYPTAATRERGHVLLEQLDAVLDDSRQSDLIRVEVEGLRREFGLDEKLSSPIDNYASFRDHVAAIRYALRLQTQDAVPPPPEPTTDDTSPTRPRQNPRPGRPRPVAAVAEPAVDGAPSGDS